MKKGWEYYAKFFIAATLIGLALFRAIKNGYSIDSMDSVFFAVIGAALILILIPIEELKSFKAGGIEISLEQTQIEGAIQALSLDKIENERIRLRLSVLGDSLKDIRGSRVLWIDDNPHKILAERRLLRALGIEVVPAISSDDAEKVLKSDNDFDLIITDVQRAGENYKTTGGIDIHDGVNFIVKIRQFDPDPVIKSIPVIFYAAYLWHSLVKWTRPARETYPEPEICNSPVDLIPMVVKRLTEARSKPLAASEFKTPTSLSKDGDDDVSRSTTPGGEERLDEREEAGEDYDGGPRRDSL